MTDDFAVLDFLMIARTPAQVAGALNEIRLTLPDDKPTSKGLLTRLFRSDGRGPRPLLVHPASRLPSGPYARTDIGANRDGSELPLRLSLAPGPARMTLVEFIETEIGQSSVARSLSGVFPDLEVFYFRYSGARHPGADYAFHVYQNGRATRRVSSLSFKGAGPDANWTATDSGLPHPAETDCLSAPETPRGEVMTPAHQGSILEALGIDTEALFTRPDPSRTGIVLSAEAGGSPIEALPAQPELDPSQRVSETPVPVLPEPERPAEPARAPKPVAELDPDGTAKLKAQPRRKIRTTGRPDILPQPVAPVRSEPAPTFIRAVDTQPDQATPQAPEAPEAPAPTAPAPEMAVIHQPTAPKLETVSDATTDHATAQVPPIGSAEWETEVTRLLLDAVEAGLPPAQQVPWLDSLTQQLQAGEIAQALTRATELINAGARSDDEKAHAVARLTSLYRAASVTSEGS